MGQTQFISTLRVIFLCFEADSGLKTDLIKLELVSVGNVSSVDSLASILGCKVSSLPMKYIGLCHGRLIQGSLFEIA